LSTSGVRDFLDKPIATSPLIFPCAIADLTLFPSAIFPIPLTHAAPPACSRVEHKAGPPAALAGMTRQGVTLFLDDRRGLVAFHDDRAPPGFAKRLNGTAMMCSITTARRLV